jgi:hypothetical protein
MKATVPDTPGNALPFVDLKAFMQTPLREVHPSGQETEKKLK